MHTIHNVVITGAKGNLGGKLRDHWKGRHKLALLDRNTDDDPQVLKADIGILSTHWVDAFKDVDTVVHLAADGIGCSDLGKLKRTNVEGTANVFKAAVQAGVRRIVFASTCHVMGKYMYTDQHPVITADLHPRPGGKFIQDGWRFDSTEYATTKLYGEKLGKQYSDENDIEVVAVRIGFIMAGRNDAKDFPVQTDEWLKQLWMSNRDFCHLMDQCLIHQLKERYLIVHGISNNLGSCWDLESTKQSLDFVADDGLTVDTKKVRRAGGYASRLQAAVLNRISVG